MNLITPISEVAKDSSNSLLTTTVFLSFMVVGYSLYYIKQKLEELNEKKEDKNEDEIIEENLFQGWSGVFADGNDSLNITILRQKVNSRGKNTEWIGWTGDKDASVITRDFYMGNENPSFDWSFTKRETDTEAIVKETMTDGWNSIIQLKVSAYIKEELNNEGMNLFLKKLIDEEKIEWQKTLYTKRELTELFN